MICDGFGVHVLGRDGRLRYGRVVDVADNGLFVDMLCSNRRREFFPSDKCFSPEFLSGDVLANHSASKSDSTVPVVVLVLETPRGPWIWVPGEISCHGRGVQYAFYEEAVVRWQDVLTGIPRTDVVPIDRIRCLQDGKRRRAVQTVEYTALHPRMQRDTFIRHSVQLDGALRSLSPEEAQTLVQRWNTGTLWYACKGIRLVDIVGDRLDYLYKSGCVISDPIEILCLVNVVKGLQDDWTFMAKMMIRDDYSGLPVELWREVFSELDTVSQTRLRIVCSTWNMLMDSPALSALIVLERRCVPCKRFPCEHFHPLLSAALFKRLRPGTRHVALVDGEGTMTPNDLLNMSDMLLYTAKHRPEIRLTGLHLTGWQISFLVNRATDHYEEPSPCVQHNPDPWSAGTYRPRLVREHCRLQDFIKIFSSLPCESLRMVNCTVKWFCPFDDHRSRPQKRGPALEMEFPEVCLNVTKDFGCMLWEACEIMLPALSDEDLQQLMQWVTGLADPDLDDDEEEELNVSVVVCKVLCATQSSDPRSSSHYRGKHWCYEGLEGLQLEKLSRIALLFLWQLALPSEKGWRYG